MLTLCATFAIPYSTRAGEKLELVSLDDYLKGLGLSTTIVIPGGEDDVEDPTV